MQMEKTEEALPLMLDVEKLIPKDGTNLQNIGAAMLRLGRYQEAQLFFQKAVNVKPQDADIHHALGHAFYYQDLCKEAYQSYRHAFALNPLSFEALQGMIYLQFYLYPTDMDQHFANVQRYGELFKHAPLKVNHPKKQPHQLTIGFVSADLRNHPVGFFLDSTLAHIVNDSSLKKQVSFVAYHNSAKQDNYSERLKAHFKAWHQVEALSDIQLIDKIQKDQIDILIDLSGHTHGNRLTVFAQKPAPIQLSWLGYWGSTGLSNIDYILADPISVPEYEEKWFVEQVWRLPHLRYCYSIPTHESSVAPLPFIQKDEIVFGSYQVLPKINEAVLRCWAAILAASPKARLRIQSKDLAKNGVKARFIKRLHDLKMDLNRIDLIEGMSHEAYFSSYGDVDIILDTFPYPGGTTTAEALWMGVPSLTLSTPGMLGRQGEALMANAGLSDWIVCSEEAYVQEAIKWANADAAQKHELATLREGMRERLRKSPIFNAQQFAHDFVSAMHSIWQHKINS